MWDRAEGTGSSFASCVGAMAASTSVADAMREFVNERVWSIIAATRARAMPTAERTGPWSRRS